MAFDDGGAALREGRGFVRPRVRVVSVRGGDAARWLNDLVTAGVAALAPGEATRSLLLTPTGRIRADVHIVRVAEGFLLVQPLDQPDAIDTLLAPYVLSSDVELAPSDVRPVLLASEAGWMAAVAPAGGTSEVDAAAAERWRIESGIARFPVDLDTESLPAEAGLDVPPVTDTAKGCFLGQESVARVRNLGHPTRMVVALLADGPVAAGDAVSTRDADDGAAGDAAAGVVTSAAGGSDVEVSVLARIRWGARGAALRTASGIELHPR